MRMDLGLQLRQEMRMRLAPQIIQSIEILQLPLLALKNRIDQELLENPLLESQEPEDQAEEAEPQSTEEQETPTEQALEAEGEEQQPEPKEEENFEAFAELAEYYSEFSGERPTTPTYDEKDPKLEALENSPAPEISLEQHLRSQLSYLELDPKTREISENIVANLDSKGYLAATLEEIVQSMDVDVTPDEAQEALGVVQQLEPLGVGASNLEECLLLQLDRRDPDSELLERIILNHFHDLSENRYPRVAKATGCSIDDVKVAAEKIGHLNPIPGSLFFAPPAPHVLPDLRVECTDGGYEVILEDASLPSLGICAYYARRLQQKNLDPKTRDYLKQKLQSARWLIEAIEQRRSTLYNVADTTVRAQKEFLQKGSAGLRPLKMQDIADQVGVHVSTVSRAISEKYIQTPHGLYPMKHFFTGGVQKQDGEMESWEGVRQKLLEIVHNEDKASPLSDDKIAEKLGRMGIKIARRTVSKYRKNLNISSSRQRKQY